MTLPARSCCLYQSRDGEGADQSNPHYGYSRSKTAIPGRFVRRATGYRNYASENPPTDSAEEAFFGRDPGVLLDEQPSGRYAERYYFTGALPLSTRQRMNHVEGQIGSDPSSADARAGRFFLLASAECCGKIGGQVQRIT